MSNGIIQATPRDFYVYRHIRATTGVCFYVGKGHGSRAYDKDSRSQYWRNIVKKHGYTVEIVQDGLQEWAAFELECDLIALHGRKDCGLGTLVNATDGGDGKSGAIASEATIAKLSKSSKERWTNPEYRANITAVMRAANLRPENIQKRREVMDQRWQDDGYRAHMTEKQKDAWANPEYKAAMVEKRKSVWESEEHREKMTAAKKKLWSNPDTHARMSAANKQSVRRPEVRAKIGEASKKAWQNPEYRANLEAHRARMWESEEHRKNISESMKIRMQNPEFRAKSLAAIAGANKAASKKVLCIETGKVFESLSEVTRFLQSSVNPKASVSALSNCCSGKQKTAYGFTWAFAS